MTCQTIQASRGPSSLPNELSSFIGRERQIDAVVSRLQTERLVTLCGAGGIGKTRLALQVGRRLQSNGVACAWVALGSLTDASELTASVSDALFGEDELVVIFDNCEQVIDACADLVLGLLQECAGVRILTTSREPLGVPGEVMYPVPPLPVDRPDGSCAKAPTEAVQLFFDRARARDPQLRLGHAAEALAGRICAACDGVPLAIELAAACAGSMTLVEIADRLEDVLGLLMFGLRAAPPRQRSIRASIDWSHGLLADKEQLLLRRLAVFESDFTLADAEWVSSFDGVQTIEIGYLLGRLVAQSLVRTSRHGSITRFSLWHPVRQYARERLVDAEELDQVQTRLDDWLEGGCDCDPCLTVVSYPQPVPRPRPRLPKSNSRGAAVLSEREHSVVQLIAGGRSNREIADELVITKKTAEAHVSHILTKLGLCSRVQIATWSLQQGVAETSTAAS